MVGVDALHTVETVVSLLGIWAAGGTYCPVDTRFPRDHADSLLAAVGGRRLADVVRRAPPSTGERSQVTAPTSCSRPARRVGPKPVAVPHRALAAVVPALVDLFGIRPDDRVLQFASLNWDTAFEEILPSLATGARVVFAATPSPPGRWPRPRRRAVSRRGRAC